MLKSRPPSTPCYTEATEAQRQQCRELVKTLKAAGFVVSWESTSGLAITELTDKQKAFMSLSATRLNSATKAALKALKPMLAVLYERAWLRKRAASTDALYGSAFAALVERCINVFTGVRFVEERQCHLLMPR